MPRSESRESVNAAQVFLSYAQRERELADAVASELKSRGIAVWDATRGIASGSVWSDTISTALEESDSMIALLNANSFSSEYVRKELDFALFNERYRNRVLPVLVGEATLSDFVQLPWILTKLEHLRLARSTSSGTAARKIVDRFVRLLSAPRSQL